ncbi:Integral membrane protein [Limimaricola hongkongensis DSM 17492]|uniref:Integral membrane protein n=1 Tax=Limimaricola hongkongensis DSM 17492 TaxID=1122180 RepID=A0A017HAE7_9RHOB|nr:Integral membrane protein [Limimaricola hongkongensis DSM 17492]
MQLWPYRSLPKRGFAGFVGGTAALIALPLLVMLGTPVMWVLLPFLAAAVAAIWWALARSYRDGEVLERLEISPERLRLTRRERGRPDRVWEANPFWVELHLHEGERPVPGYLTLRGAGREVELGAFLPEEERRAIAEELQRLLARSGRQ